jgi:serine/threonine protein kinase
MEVTKEANNDEEQAIYLDKKYALLKQIGEGGFGRILLAKNVEDNKYVAIKMNRIEEKGEIESEIKLITNFDHPNVLSIEDYSIKKGVLERSDNVKMSDTVTYMVMPYAYYGDMSMYLRGDSYFEEDVAAYLFQQMFYGLRHIHHKGYVHLDIKPDNILISKDLRIMIADFGLSQPKKGEDEKGTFNNRRCGTKTFWSPEIALGFEYNGEQADIYALAIILFIMIFGCRPFREIKIDDPLFMKLLKEPLGFWMTHPITKNRIKNRSVSEEVVDLLARMLLVNPEQRITKEEILKHPWMNKFSKDIYQENDYEEFTFAPEILDEENDSDYIINEEDMKSSDSEDVSLKTETEKSQNDEDIDDLLQLRLIPKTAFLEKVQQVLKSIRENRK